ncbi:TetR/AcrR family transcriptional regulator [Cryobacterium lactosi]|uniref:TetR/AcrR family transcriptional regulator n=1 Tax=Cryobacterium lactosi TaxID=1259202 RepID=A0A4R9BW37_9MICO|nr:TetR/AcrR family transcriptional regulator [Cryobacterium lactosi]TFD92056.1 TetR/AcrR family transcriptional regulator [Cryobacterium lactosi]
MTTRTYASPRRAQGAAETRRAILRAALDVFEDKGYTAASLAEIAAKAQVSLNTIYVSVGKKPQLLLAIFEEATSDADIDSTLAGVESEDSPLRIIAHIAHGTRVIFERHSWALGELYDNAATSEEFTQTIAASEAQYRARLGVAAARVAALHAPLDAGRASDVLWFYFGFRPWRELRKLSWSWDDAEMWLSQQAASALL